MAFVQDASGQVAQGVATGTVTLGAAPTAGNLLVFAAGCDKNTTTGSVSDGTWDHPVDLNGTSTSLHVFWKISDGTETAVDFTRGNNSASGDNLWMGEYSDTGVWELIESQTNPTSESSVSSTSTGTTAATPRAGQGIAFISKDSHQSDTVTWTRSYTARRQTQLGLSNAAGGLWVAERLEESGNAAESTGTISGTADQLSGAVLVFAPAAGGGPPPSLMTLSPTRSGL